MAIGRKTGGRAAGTPNRGTAEIKAVARQHGPKIIEGLWNLFNDPKVNEAARIAAGRELLDRGYGKPAVSLADADGGPITVVHKVQWLK
jgi:hypothetical protein